MYNIKLFDKDGKEIGTVMKERRLGDAMVTASRAYYNTADANEISIKWVEPKKRK
jgi:ABC-type sulfate transport system substrate-binding protein